MKLWLAAYAHRYTSGMLITEEIEFEWARISSAAGEARMHAQEVRMRALEIREWARDLVSESHQHRREAKEMLARMRAMAEELRRASARGP